MKFKQQQKVIHYWYYSKNFPAVVAGAILKTAKAKEIKYTKYVSHQDMGVNIHVMNHKTLFIIMYLFLFTLFTQNAT